MKRILIALVFTVGLGIFTAKAQAPTTTKPTPPTAPTDQDMNTQDDEDVVFPPDVVDTTISDTSEIDDIKVDSTMRMENKGTYENREKVKPNKEKRKNKM